MDNDQDGVADSEHVIVREKDLTNSIHVHGSKLYASTANAIYRWSYSEGQTTLSTDRETVIEHIPSSGDHPRSIAFDYWDRLYISTGGKSDTDSFTVRRFVLPSNISAGPMHFDEGKVSTHCCLLSPRLSYSLYQVMADGLRNTKALSFDRHGALWGVDRGPKDLLRQDRLGPAADELNCLMDAPLSTASPTVTVTASPSSPSFPPSSPPSSSPPTLLPSTPSILPSLSPPTSSSSSSRSLLHSPRSLNNHSSPFFGFPLCLTQYSPAAAGEQGDQYASPLFLGVDDLTDAWCSQHARRPEVPLPAGSNPTGLAFFDALTAVASHAKTCGKGSFPTKLHGDAFLALHGSGHGAEAVGYKACYRDLTRPDPT